MKRFLSAASGWRVGVVAGVLLVAAFARPAMGDEGPQPNSKNTNLTATAKYSASSEWENGNPTYLASKAFDGDYTSRWNVASGDSDGSWLAATWDNPVTINKVVMYEDYDRLAGFRIQTLDSGGNWVDAYVAEDAGYTAVKSTDPAQQANPVYKIRLAQPIQTKGLRALFTQTTSAPTIFELEAWNNPSGTLTGTVTDTSGNPIQGATVTAGGDSAVSDASGKYTLSTDAGTYNVTAGKFGVYRDRIARSVALPANGAATHDFVLIPLPPNLSLTAAAVSSSNYSPAAGYEADKANDGKPTTRWNSDDGDTDGAYLETQWKDPQTFDKVVIYEAYDRIRNYSLQTYDEANAKYVDIPGASNIDVPAQGGDATVNVKPFTHIFATPITTKRLRLQINSADSLPSIWEMQAFNAPLGTVAGVVTDVATGKPVPNATLTSDLGQVLGSTDANGAFSIVLDADDYIVTASANGYFAGAPVAFTVNGGDKQQVTVTAPAQGPDIALTAKASASSEDPSSPASLVNDGDLDTNWLSTDPTNVWVALTWDKPTHFTVVQLRGFGPYYYQTSYLEMLDTDGKTWVQVPGTTFSPEVYAAAKPPIPADFYLPDGVTTTGLRFFATSTNSTSLNGGLAEMLVYDSPLPKPAQ